MRRSSRFNQNPQKQEAINIVGYLNTTKLFRKEHEKLSNPRRSKDQDRRSDFRIKFDKSKKQKSQKSPISGRHTFISQNYPNKEELQFQGFYTSRNPDQQPENRVSFQFDDSSSNQRTNYPVNINHVNLVPRNRFYYRNQQSAPQNNGKNDKLTPQNQQSFSYRRVLPGYFNKLNSGKLNDREFSPYSQLNRARKQSRSKSPLQQSHNRLFSKCYKQTLQYLHVMLRQVHQSQDHLHIARKNLGSIIYDTIKQRSTVLRQELIDLVEELVSEWERKEWQCINEKEIEYMDDLLELEEQAHERQSRINQLIKRLDQERKNDIGHYSHDFTAKTTQKDLNQRWKSVTADLLMSDYENSILQTKQLAQKMCLTIGQKYNKAISLLPSTLIFQKSSHYEILIPQTKKLLKNTILQILNHPECQNGKQSTENFGPQKQKSVEKIDLQRFRDSLFTLSEYRMTQN